MQDEKGEFVSENGNKILVMDDEDIVAEIAKQMLNFLGYEVSVVENGEQAVTLYRQAHETGSPFSLVIMDLNIPQGMGGIEAVKQVLDIDKAAKVIVSSGYSSDPIMVDYAEYGFIGCIAKPFDLEGLKSAISAAMV